MITTQNAGHLSPILKENTSFSVITKLSKHHLKPLFEYSYGFDNPKQFIDFVSKTEPGKRFINFTSESDDDAFSYITYDVCKPFRILVR